MLHRPERILLCLYGLFALAMVLLNVFQGGGGDLWAQWPIWGVAVPVAGLLGAIRLRRHRFLGFWLGAGIMLALGLTAIDLLMEDGALWFFWPVGAWIAATAVIFGLSVDVLAMVPTSEPAPEPRPSAGTPFGLDSFTPDPRAGGNDDQPRLDGGIVETIEGMGESRGLREHQG